MLARVSIVLMLAAGAVLVGAAEPAVIRFERAALLSRPAWPNFGAGEDSYFKLRLVISPSGSVTSVEVADRGFASQAFIDTAIQYVKGYKFRPAMRDGVPVEQRVVQPFSFSTGKHPAIGPRFQAESKKVADLIKSGDLEGGNFHAEWMLSEVVRTRYEHLALKGTLGQTLASMGEFHRAIDALRAATPRTNPAPAFALHEKVPKNSPDNYLLRDAQYVAGLLDLKMRLAAAEGFVREALQAYYELAGLVRMKPDDPRAVVAEKLATILRGDGPLVGHVKLGDRGGWVHELYRRSFTLDQVQGKVDEIMLNCRDEHRVLQYMAGQEWAVPESWSDCTIDIKGEPGVSLRIVEFANTRPPGAVVEQALMPSSD
jgi:TonB family protein